MNFRKKRIQLLLLVVGIIIALTIAANKCRELVGDEASSKTGQFTILQCFDGSTGTLGCAVKEGVKLYFNNIRDAHVEMARHQAMEEAVIDALSQGMNAKYAKKHAQKEGERAAKFVTRQVDRILGPIISSGWDFFEVMYFGGTMAEGLIKGTGTLSGTYVVGCLGQQMFGRFGYTAGSQMGSWVGGRIGIMVFEVLNGLHFLFLE